MAKALLISLRDPEDAMCLHEHRCFSLRSGLDPTDLDLHYMAKEKPSRAMLSQYHTIFFGGSGNYSALDDVDWIKHGLDALQHVVDLQIPAWASCFGFHGLSLALGGVVKSYSTPLELGASRLYLTEEGKADPLVGTLPHEFWGQQGHCDEVTELPDGVTLLVSGDVCKAQGFRVNNAPFWASQFHPELTREWTLERFRHYQSKYLDPAKGDTDDTLEHLSKQPDSPELADLLVRLVRGEF